jgi:hypothetical protein
MQNAPNFISAIGIQIHKKSNGMTILVDLFIRSVIGEVNHGDIKYRVTPNIILSIAINYLYKDSGWGGFFNVIDHYIR